MCIMLRPLRHQAHSDKQTPIRTVMHLLDLADRPTAFHGDCRSFCLILLLVPDASSQSVGIRHANSQKKLEYLGIGYARSTQTS